MISLPPLKALELQPEDKSCFVARSKCYLQLGDASAALQDAETSLKEDKKYHRVRMGRAARRKEPSDAVEENYACRNVLQ